jgi:hypothetical protein
MKKEKDIIALAKKRFEKSADAESKNRKRFVESLKFVDLGKQWGDDLLAEREKDGRPCMVINKAQAAVRQITNDARQTRPSILARPVDSKSDPKLTEVLNGLIRDIENNSEAQTAYNNGIEFAVKGGWGYWRVLIEYSQHDIWEKEIKIKRIVNPCSVYDDPSAREANRSDRRFLFITDNMPRDDFKNKYPKIKTEGWDVGEGESGEDWVGEETVRVAEYYYIEKAQKTMALIATPMPDGTLDKDTIELTEDIIIVEVNGEQIIETEQGKAVIQKTKDVEVDEVWWCKIGGNDFIEKPVKQSGRYIPVVYCAGDETWIEGEPVIKSAVFHSLDAARMYNWARSNSVETLALAPKQPYIGTPAMFDGFEKDWDEANRKPKMRLMANFDNGQLPQRQQFSIRDSGALAEAMQAADDIKSTMGLYDASLGAPGNETSGRAIHARQKEGENATFHFHDNQASAIKFTGKIILDLIPYVYDTERVIRITNEDNSIEWAEINKTVLDTESPTGVKVLHDLTASRYDVAIDAGQNYLTKRRETVDMMANFLSTAPEATPVLLPRIARALDWPDSAAIGDEIQQVFSPPPPKEATPQEQLEIEGKQLDVAKKQAELQKSQVKDVDLITDVAQKAVIEVLNRLGLLPPQGD